MASASSVPPANNLVRMKTEAIETVDSALEEISDSNSASYGHVSPAPAKRLPSFNSSTPKKRPHCPETPVQKETHEILNSSESFTDHDASSTSQGVQSSFPSSIHPTVPMLIMGNKPKRDRFNSHVPTLCYNGHIYRKVPVSSYPTRLEWECSRRVELGCGALTTTDYNVSRGQTGVTKFCIFHSIIVINISNKWLIFYMKAHSFLLNKLSIVAMPSMCNAFINRSLGVKNTK